MGFNVDTNSQVVYVVTADGYDGYGAEIYLIGVYNNLEIAERCQKQCGSRAQITTVVLNQDYPLVLSGDILFSDNYRNENYLGGYCE